MLAVQEMPPLSVPLRFFLTAPLFGIAGGLILLFHADSILLTRWHPATLAALHCFTAGLMLQAMLGALFQVLPVLTGAPIARPRLIAGVVHPASAVGAAALVAGFLWPDLHLAAIGAALLCLACCVFLGASLLPLLRSGVRGPTRACVLLSLSGLLVTVLLGTFCVAQLETGSGRNFAAWVNLHALWALAGWALPLVVGVGILFVPMFYMTPPYPPRVLATGLAALGAALLTGSTALRGSDAFARPGALLACVVAAGFALLTLQMFRRRKRPRNDATALGWQMAMAALAGAALLFALRLTAAYPRAEAGLELAAGALLVAGAFTQLIGAMLLRILPFLASLHLATRGGGWRLDGAPGAPLQKLQIGLQAVATLLLVIACWVPVLAQPAFLFVLAAQGVLMANVAGFARALLHARPVQH